MLFWLKVTEATRQPQFASQLLSVSRAPGKKSGCAQDLWAECDLPSRWNGHIGGACSLSCIVGGGQRAPLLTNLPKEMSMGPTTTTASTAILESRGEFLGELALLQGWPWVHQNRVILCGCGGDLHRSPKKSRNWSRPQDARFPLRRESLAKCDFFCEESGVKTVLAAEFPAIPSSPVKIASERRCASLVHSGLAHFLDTPWL